MRSSVSSVWGVSVLVAGLGACRTQAPTDIVREPLPAVPRITTADAPPRPAPAAALDPFGIAMIHPTKPGGHVWFARWTTPRTLRRGARDPLDAEFQKRGNGVFEIHGDGTATGSGAVTREYVWDKTGGKQWHDVELTFYGMRVSEQEPRSYAGFVVEVRTADGHVDDPARQCDGASYAMAMYYDGRAEFKKEGKHPVYSSKNPSAKIWPGGGPMPYGKWIGFKATVRDTPEGFVELALYRDLTDGAGGGAWEKVLEHVDRGGWVVGDGAPICGRAADRILTGAHPVVLLRNDGATTRYEKLSVREI